MEEGSIEQVMSRLDATGLLDTFADLVRSGFDVYQSYDPKWAWELSQRSQASCIYDHMVAEASRRLSGNSRVKRIQLRGGLLVWVVDEFCAFRLKKMDENGKGRNYPTKQAKDYDYHRQLEGLPPAPIRITLGYLQDATGKSIERVQIARPNGSNVDWCAAIIPAEERKAGGKSWEEVSRQPKFGT